MLEPIERRRLLDGSRDLPTLPTVVTKVNQMARDPRVSAAEVARVISEDQALTAKVLKLVNSPFYGFPQRVTNITRAIVILGFNRVRNLALTASVLSSFQTGHGGFSIAAFWAHSIATAIAADSLAKILRLPAEEEDAFTAGLLHDIGKLVHIQLFKDEFAMVLQTVGADDCLIMEAERRVMGVSHAETGGWLAERWSFPPSISAAIRLHHQPEQAREHRRLVMVVHLSDILARAIGLGSGGDMRLPVVSEDAWRELGVQRGVLDKCFDEMSSGVEKSVEFLEMVR